MKKLMIMIILVILVTTGCSTKINKKEIQTPPEDINSEYVYKLKVDTVSLDEELIIKGITEGVLVVNHKFPWDANSMIIEIENGEVVLIDTPYENEATRKIVEWIQEQMDQNTKITVINTGFHFDNLGGNQYLVNEGIEIIGTSKSVEMIKERGESARSLFLEWLKKPEFKKYYDVYNTLEYVEPTKIINIDVDEEIIVPFREEELVLYYPEESHTPDNIVVYYPRKKVLFGGCMVKAAKSKTLGNTADANIVGWKESIKKLEEKYTAENIYAIVPGHGEVGDYSLLNTTKKLLEEVIE